MSLTLTIEETTLIIAETVANLGGGGAVTFLGLTDTPGAYTGESLKVARVKSDETGLEFAAISGTGDVVGPSGAIANNLAVFNGTTGKLIKDGGKTIAEVFNTDNHTSGTTNKVFTAVEQSKLAGIEALADVTDAANVDAAGATMNADTSLAGNGYFLDEDNMASDSAVKVPSQQSVKAYADAREVAAKAYADGLVVGLWDDRGSFDASGGSYPSSGGSGTAGAIKKGDVWTISVAGTLPTAQVVEVGDVVRALVDTPGNTQANWAITQNNIGYVAENQANKENTTLDTSTTKYPTNRLVKEYADTKQGLDATLTALAGLATGANKIPYSTGTDTFGQLDFKDEDDMASDSATAVPSQQSVKAYADTKVAKSAVPCEFIIACSDLSTALTTGTGKAYFRAPYAFTLTAVRASLFVAGGTSGTTTIDINESGTTVLSTKLTIDQGEKTSQTAATPAVISDSAIADDAEITIDIDAISGGATEAGLIVILIGTHSV